MLVPPDDPGALADALVRLLGDPPLVRSLGAAARAESVARFDLRSTLDELADLTRSVATRGGRIVAPRLPTTLARSPR
jgi:glycosyltransferase involved in cell wall biosynthesis